MPIFSKLMTDALDDVLKPILEAKGLPNEYYISEGMFAKERRELFFKTWSAVGFENDIPDPGDAFPLDFLGMPLLLVRGKDGVVNVFQNTCRHRGMILVDEPKHLKGPIRCPYHSWAYSHDGDLIKTPYVGGVDQDTHDAVDCRELSLFEIRSRVWQGVVFVNVSGDAPDFEIEHENLLRRWGEFDQPYFCDADSSKFQMSVKTNWKLAVENYCESYHLPWIHPELNSISNIDNHYHIHEEENYAGQGSHIYNQLEGEGGLKFPDFDALSEKWDLASEYVAVFPNVLLGVHRDHAFAMLLMPQGPGETLERVALCYTEDGATKDKWAPMRARNAELWRNIFAEDVGVVEGMQKGRHGPFFDGGKFSPVMDVPTHVFHKWVARHMQALD
jgi:phenylpropionate dioxygenase-like ring-hydroxylating dioxygenase large terminal subunit